MNLLADELNSMSTMVDHKSHPSEKLTLTQFYEANGCKVADKDKVYRIYRSYYPK